MRHAVGVFVIPLCEQRQKERPEPAGLLLGRLNNAAVIIPHERGVRDESDVRRVLFPRRPLGVKLLKYYLGCRAIIYYQQGIQKRIPSQQQQQH